MLNRFFCAITIATTFSVGAYADVIITQWDFNDSNDSPSTGVGVIGVIGGATHPGFNSGNGSSDGGQAYQTTTYAAQGEESGLRGIRVDVDTTGFFGIKGSFDLRTSNTSSRWFQVQYTTDGTNFIDFGTPVRMGEEANAGDSWHNLNTFDLSAISGVNNNPNFGFQVVSVFSPIAFTEVNSGISFDANTAYEVARNTTSNYAGGTWRFDALTVSGTAIPEPTAMVILGGTIMGCVLRRRK